MLSPRALHFSSHQIFWDCAEISACETLPNGLPLPLDRRASADRHWRGRLQESGTNRHISVSGANDDSIDDFWRTAIENYTTCDLTNQGDKRVAVWGIAKLVRDLLGEEYGAGMWEHSLEEQLAWRAVNCMLTKRLEQLAVNPSWSWTSVQGTVHLPTRLTPKRAYTVRDHDGRPISFNIEEKARPVLTRERSEDMRQELKAMSKDLDDMRKKREDLSAAVRVPHYFDRSNGRLRFLVIALGILQTWAAFLYRYLHPERKEPILSRDHEPKLTDKRIAMQGYVNTAHLHWNKSAEKWTLGLADKFNCNPEDAIVDAFPDVKQGDINAIADDTRVPTSDRIQHMLSYKAWFSPVIKVHRSTNRTMIQGDTTAFVILALSEFGESIKSTPSHCEPGAEQWYGGVGIMLQPSEERPGYYFRTGALHFEQLSGKMWERLKAAGHRDEASLKFFLV
jgi:hypothetical protein